MFEHTKPQTPSFLKTSMDRVKKEQSRETPFWLTALRQEGRLLFEQMGLPAQKLEEWKYTDVSPISQFPFVAPGPISAQSTAPLSPSPLFLPLSPCRLVFVNGFFSPSLSQVPVLPAGVQIGSLAAALKENNPLLETHLANYAIPEDSSFVALNNAFLEDGAFVYIPAGILLAEPLHLVYLHVENNQMDKNTPEAYFPRNLIVVEAGASATIIEDYSGTPHTLYMDNPVTEIRVAENASVHHYKLQRESTRAFHIATISVRQESNSQFTSHSFSFGAALTRNNIHSYLEGIHSECHFNGLVMLKGTQHADNHTLIHHSHPHCHSNQLYHSILDEKSRAIFNGKIYVEAEAQKTDSRQTNRSLMLSNDSRVDSKPQLEIFADDVKCSHGATVGRLDTDSLFYLRSRGVSANDARKMLTLAFGQQVSGLIKNASLRETIEAHIAQQLDEDRPQE